MCTENRQGSYSPKKWIKKEREKKKKKECPTLESCSPNWSSFCCRGVFSCSVAAIWSRILPISVATPVATATPIALPAAMFVP